MATVRVNCAECSKWSAKQILDIIRLYTIFLKILLFAKEHEPEPVLMEVSVSWASKLANPMDLTKAGLSA